MARNDSHVEIMDQHWVEIKNNLSVSDDLLARLVEDGVITFNENETIKASAALEHLWINDLILCPESYN
jgi:hypothetical protein